MPTFANARAVPPLGEGDMAPSDGQDELRREGEQPGAWEALRHRSQDVQRKDDRKVRLFFVFVFASHSKGSCMGYVARHTFWNGWRRGGV